MSDERDLYVDGYPMADFEYAWEAGLDIVFSERHYFTRSAVDAHPIVRQTRLSLSKDDDDPYEPDTLHYLIAPASEVRERLRIYGYTPKKLRQMWSDARDEYIEDVPRMDEMLARADPQFQAEENTRATAIIAQSFEDWCVKIAEEFSAHKPGVWNPRHPGTGTRVELSDPFAQLAVLLNVAHPQFIWLDLTDLYPSHYDPELTPQANANAINSQYQDDSIGGILILTEGKADSRIISKAVHALYPAYADILSFVDFEGFRIEGGASPLAKMVKVFAGVKQNTRIIAIFDNDAAGFEAIASLHALSLPPNMRVMTLPDILLATDYPTIGPEGLRSMNVNGTACTIEMFLGRSALSNSEGALHPVRWTQWNKVAARYQGAIDHKTSAEAAFMREISEEGIAPDELRRSHPEMDQLLSTIFAAFD